MSAPLTPFEATGDWTSLATEQNFLESLHGTGGMSFSEIGRSVQDRPIWACTFGEGTATAVILSMQHGPEPATREASLAIIRDLAHRADPWMDDYLTSHRVVVIPTMSPDGVENWTRNNANGVNLNRDWWQIEQPETTAVQDLLTDLDPDIVMDSHETSGQPGGDWRPYPAGYPLEHQGLRDLAREFVDDTEQIFTGEGWSTLWYPVSLLPYAGLSTVASAMNRIGILSETVSYQITPVQRVDISHATYRELLAWHHSHAPAIHTARAAAQAATALPGPTPIPTRQYVGTINHAETHATGYHLSEPLPQKYVDYFGIIVAGNQISLLQPARRAIAALCDPVSAQKVVEATPLYETLDDAPRKTYGTVQHAGLRYPIQQVITHHDGTRYPVQQVITQSGGARSIVGGAH